MKKIYTPKTQRSVVNPELMRVYCRLKPILPNASSCINVVSDTAVQLSTQDVSKSSKLYKFKRVYTETKTQKEIFDDVALPLIELLVRGKNGLLFTYGVTGSGKTYTMMGTKQNTGIMPRCLNVLFNSINEFQANRFTFKPNRRNGFIIQSEVEAEHDRNKASNAQRNNRSQENLSSAFDQDNTKVTIGDEDNAYAVFVTYVEVYNDLVYDLLDDTSNALHSKTVLQDASGVMFVHGVTEIEVQSMEEAFELFHKGQKRRHMGATRLNINSSRSHCVFNIKLVQAPLDEKGEHVLQDNGKICTSQLSLVDLAGSERANRTKNTGIRLEEGSRINQSLLYLRKCLRDLREQQKNTSAKVHVSFRQCKIMWLLKSFFENGGDCRMIVCVNPHINDAEENSFVMQFAETSQDIMMKSTPMTMGLTVGLTPGRRRVNQAYKRTLKMLEEIREHDLSTGRVSVEVGSIGTQCYKEFQQKILDELRGVKEEYELEIAQLKLEIYAEVNEFKKKILQELLTMKKWMCSNCGSQSNNKRTEHTEARIVQDSLVIDAPDLYLHSETPKGTKEIRKSTGNIKGKQLFKEFDDGVASCSYNDDQNEVVPSNNHNEEVEYIQEKQLNASHTILNTRTDDLEKITKKRKNPRNEMRVTDAKTYPTATDLQTECEDFPEMKTTEDVEARIIQRDSLIIDNSGHQLHLETTKGTQKKRKSVGDMKKKQLFKEFDDDVASCSYNEDQMELVQSNNHYEEVEFIQEKEIKVSQTTLIPRIKHVEKITKKQKNSKNEIRAIYEKTYPTITDQQTECKDFPDTVFPTDSEEISQKSYKQTFRCDKCDKDFETRGKFNKHNRIHLKVRPYVCCHCDKKFTRKQGLERHVRIHLNIRPYKCDHCSKKFTRKSHLERHIRIHLNTRPYKCDHCSKKFTQKSALDSHVRMHLNIRPYKCDHCSKKFTQKSHLERHVRIHLNIRPYKCDHCSKKFTDKSNLDSHVRIHLNIRPYKCDHCSKKFTRKSDLDSHVRIHLNIRPYKCDHCSKKFTQKSALDSHVRIHLNIRPYECDYCGKMFIHKSNLIYHIKTHMGIKPFKCPHCGNKFVTLSHLKNHTSRIHLNPKLYHCEICKSSFKRKPDIRRHIIRTHAESTGKT